jgi:type I restriction enzyme S subunit
MDNVLCGYHLAQITPDAGILEGKYLFRAFSARGLNDQFRIAATGITRYGLGKYWLDNSFFPVPSMDEQRAISTFLDRETKRIDTLIAKKERQIELLQEKRAALISHVVTKGLNPNAKMKNSDIEWLGEIPEHWIVCLLKRVAEMAYGMSGELDRTLTQGTRILSLPNVNIDGELILDDVPHADVPEEQRSNLLLKHGDLLFNWRNGSSDHLGKTAFFDLEGDYTHVSFLLRLRFNSDRHDSRYFQRLLSGLRITGFFSSSKAGVNNTFNQSELANLWVMVPPLEEQRSIADFLDKEVYRIKDQTAKIQQSIDRLHEYRSALVYAAVTGRIDVRKEVGK